MLVDLFPVLMIRTMIKNVSTGFLVVMVLPEYHNNRNRRYRGVDRMPEYPSTYIEEAYAIDEYVFGDFKDKDTNLIPTFDRAVKLYRLFNSSSRAFEIIFCSPTPDNAQDCKLGTGADLEMLGFDVAGTSGDCWSIVQDIPGSDWTLKYLAALNPNGLFTSHVIASDYLGEYKLRREADFDSDLDVVHVATVRAL